MRKQCFQSCLDYVIISIGSIWGVGSVVLAAGPDRSLTHRNRLRTSIDCSANAGLPSPLYSTLSSLALMATTIVEALISTAPIAGLNIKEGYKTPAANGMAITL